jgi:signal transduction histidine kinase
MDQFVVADAQNYMGINIRVTDEGIGISAEDRRQLFQMYFKSNDLISQRMNKGSHGLGLSICKRFA